MEKEKELNKVASFREKPKAGEVWKHFKGGVYQILAIGQDTETSEERIMYQDIDGKIHDREMTMFMSPATIEHNPSWEEKSFRFWLSTEHDWLKALEKKKLAEDHKAKVDKLVEELRVKLLECADFNVSYTPLRYPEPRDLSVPAGAIIEHYGDHYTIDISYAKEK